MRNKDCPRPLISANFQNITRLSSISNLLLNHPLFGKKILFRMSIILGKLKCIHEWAETSLKFRLSEQKGKLWCASESTQQVSKNSYFFVVTNFISNSDKILQL